MLIKDIGRKLHKYGDEYVEFYIANMDTAGTTRYYGWIGNDGYWLIMKWDTTTNIFTYASGQAIGTYTVNWDATGAYVGALTFKSIEEVL